MVSDERFGEYPTTEAPRLCSDLIEYAAVAQAAIADPNFEWDENEVSADDLEEESDDEEVNKKSDAICARRRRGATDRDKSTCNDHRI
jgi:hypothetical protein